MTTTPIFIITFNQAHWLSRTIESYRALSAPIDIIVHDNGSDRAEMIDLLASLEGEGVSVSRQPKIAHVDELNNVNRSINAYFGSETPTANYVVTDPDIDLTGCDPQLLSVFEEMLGKFPEAACVGPMLRIDDIPVTYPLRAAAIRRHVDQFWKHQPKWTDLDWGRVAYQFAPVDTTFALHRAGEPFKRLKKGIRVYHPFEARHLDWYINERQAVPGGDHISHWATDKLIQANKAEQFREREFHAVHAHDDGLVARRCFTTAEGFRVAE